MASIHYGTPSSLPTDYAILSHCANANARANAGRDEQPHNFSDRNEPTDMQGDVNPDRSVIRRSSFPLPYSRPLKPRLSEPSHSKTFVYVANEYTPLLVPRIEEEVAASADPNHPQSTTKVYRDEFRTLFKYTLPVFGYASSSRFTHCPGLDALSAVHTCWNTPSQ